MSQHPFVSHHVGIIGGMTGSTADAQVGLLASRQRGVISRAQALELGMTDAAMQRRIRSGRWTRRYAGVYVVAGTPSSWLHDLWCGYLAVGPSAVVTHETALCLRGVDRVRPRPLTFTVPHGGHARLDGVFVHQIDDLRPHRVTTEAGLAVSTVERAVVELASVVGTRHLGDVLDDVVAAGKVSLASVAASLREVARPGKPGVAKLARVLEVRGDGYVPPQSELERALFAALAAGGLPEPRRQFQLPGCGAIEGLVDAAYPDARLIIEADGRRWHTRVRDLKRDHMRVSEAARVGWQTLRFGWEEIVHTPRDVCAAIADVLLVRSPEAMVVAGAGSRR
jgi:very-short-patch-repair endonuclease